MVVVPSEVVLVVRELHFVFGLVELHCLPDPILLSSQLTQFLGRLLTFQLQFGHFLDRRASIYFQSG